MTTAHYERIEVDLPVERVARITLNQPEKRNAISTTMRAELLDALHRHDNDPEVRVTVIRGAGNCFSSGYELGGAGLMQDAPFPTAPGDGQWARHATDSWLQIWDLAKPVIAQIHGYALAGATELAAACDLVYVADDAEIGHPVVKVLSPPDFNYHPWLVGVRHAMELMLTGDAIDGTTAAAIGFANRAVPADQLEATVLAIAARVASVAPDLQQVNKRSVRRAMEVMGVRTAIRNATELQALAQHLPSVQEFKSDALANIKQAARDDN